MFFRLITEVGWVCPVLTVEQPQPLYGEGTAKGNQFVTHADSTINYTRYTYEQCFHSLHALHI